MNSISLDQLIVWHTYFSTHPSPTTKIKEITQSLENHLHEILTKLMPTPTKES